MPTNPLYQSNDSPNNSTQPTKAVNRQGVYVPRTHNTFDMSYFHYMTQRFGFYEPFFAMEGVPGDIIPLSSSHNVRSLPMSSPFLSELRINKDYFMIPMQAIMPNTWELIYKTPVQGDDVPDDANCLFTLWDYFGNTSFIKKLLDTLRISINDNAWNHVLWVLLNLELFLSQGSLLAQLGYHVNVIIHYSGGKYKYSFDDFFDMVVNSIDKFEVKVTNFDDEVKYLYFNRNGAPLENTASLHQILSMMRNYGSKVEIISLDMALDSFITSFSSLPEFFVNDDFGPSINLQRIIAYQVACSQFYVNPQVDYIYNSKLYLDNIYTLWSILMDSMGYDNSIKHFDYNGTKVLYDYCSKAYFMDVVLAVIDGDLGNDDLPIFYDYLHALFGHRESLRFGDYFTDSRTRPLADGDNNIQVSDVTGVNVIDVTRKIVYQRFRNAVVKLGNNFGDYLRGIFGTSPSPDYHYPKFISHNDAVVKSFEVANSTSDDQGKLVTNLNSQDDRYAFEVTVDMPCVILGVSYFSVPRVYMQTKERHFFHRDRYDQFNPMLQYVGDQTVYNHERTDLVNSYDIFGYQSRYNEYKQRYSVVSGGFASKLPAWTFVADSMFDPIDDIIVENTQNPYYIRNHDYEFNRFFAALSGYSLASAFHFIVVYNNKCVATRPMEINPSIL